jgi:hypothetical protein
MTLAEKIERLECMVSLMLKEMGYAGISDQDAGLNGSLLTEKAIENRPRF